MRSLRYFDASLYSGSSYSVTTRFLIQSQKKSELQNPTAPQYPPQILKTYAIFINRLLNFGNTSVTDALYRVMARYSAAMAVAVGDSSALLRRREMVR